MTDRREKFGLCHAAGAAATPAAQLEAAAAARAGWGRRATAYKPGRGLPTSTFRLNVSAFCGIGGACGSCLGSVEEVPEGIRGCVGVYVVSETAQVELSSGRV
jgi:hypothetical protein